MSVREDYDLPKSPPPALRFLGFVLAFVLLALLVGAIAAGSPVLIAVAFVLLAAAVGFGVFRILSSRALTQPPGENPEPPR